MSVPLAEVQASYLRITPVSEIPVSISRISSGSDLEFLRQP
jgi:hypothetical protein